MNDHVNGHRHVLTLSMGQYSNDGSKIWNEQRLRPRSHWPPQICGVLPELSQKKRQSRKKHKQASYVQRKAGIPRHRHRHPREDRRENVGVSFSLPQE